MKMSCVSVASREGYVALSFLWALGKEMLLSSNPWRRNNLCFTLSWRPWKCSESSLVLSVGFQSNFTRRECAIPFSETKTPSEHLTRRSLPRKWGGGQLWAFLLRRPWRKLFHFKGSLPLLVSFLCALTLTRTVRGPILLSSCDPNELLILPGW